MQSRGPYQRTGSIALIVSLLAYAYGYKEPWLAAGRDADEFARSFMTMLATAQEYHRLDAGRFGTVDELLARGNLNRDELARLDWAQLNRVTLVSFVDPSGQEFWARATPHWQVWGSASHWYVDSSLAVTHSRFRAARPDDPATAKIVVIVCAGINAP